MALAYTKLKIEIREISLKDRPPELYKSSKKGTVPVLITTDNIVIDESLDIILWSLNECVDQKWLPRDCSQELKIIKKNDNEFKKWLDRYKYHDRYPDKSKKFYRKKCGTFLNDYEIQLSKSKYLSGNQFNIVDVCIFPFVRQFANVDIIWFENEYKNISFWLSEICNSLLFKAVMKKNDLWQSSNCITINYKKLIR